MGCFLCARYLCTPILAPIAPNGSNCPMNQRGAAFVNGVRYWWGGGGVLRDGRLTVYAGGGNYGCG